MIKLLIADDEPLVCIGVQSMLDWEEYDIEVVGTARNGKQAADMIEQLRPDIVITDIKMPLKTGLELAEECTELYGSVPLFIILTSYDEFNYVRKAIRFQAVDYLIKLELTPEVLAESIKKAVSILSFSRHKNSSQGSRSSLQVLRDKFFLRLYNCLFDSEEQLRLQMSELDITFTSPAYTVISCEILLPSNPVSGSKLIALCNSVIQTVQNMIEKAFPCYITVLDVRQFCIAAGLLQAESDPQKLLQKSLQKAAAVVHNYFNVELRIAAGKTVEDPALLNSSYLFARQLMHQTTAANPLLFPAAGSQEEAPAEAFAAARRPIRKAFEELDAAALYEALTGLADSFRGQQNLRLQALDAASNVLFMATTFLPDGENLIRQVFAAEPGGYRSLYSLGTTDAIVGWLLLLRDGCCELLASRAKTYQQQVINNVREYIHENLDKKLALSDVAAVFGFNPNYLSQLFSRLSGEGFVDYITTARIEAAKEMMHNGDGRIYEIAERLGFESAFYFSKVFKKKTGKSPREYLNSRKNPVS